MKESFGGETEKRISALFTRHNIWKRLARLLIIVALPFGLLAVSTLANASGRPAALDPVLSAAATDFDFVRTYIDTNYGGNGNPGWTDAGDMDQDGDIDIVAGGGRGLFIYENNGVAGGWTRYGNLDETSEMGANGGVLFDVDSDGDLDVVSAKYRNDLGWWENPGGALNNSTWLFHAFGDTVRFLHDIIVADLDKDGKAEEFITNLNSGYWDASIGIKWFRPGADVTQYWESHTIEESRNEGDAHGHAGMDVGDIDKDGHVDLAFSNGWYEAPDDPATGNWIWYPESDIYGISNALLEDMDGDTDLDRVVSAGHHGQGVYWLENDGSPASGSWERHNISAVVGDITARHRYDANAPEHLHHPECLALIDFGRDGDLDVVTCDLYFGEDPGEPGWDEEAHNVYIYENLGNSLSWEKHNIAPNSYPSHLLQLADINQDGRLDIISESAGYSVVSYYENNTGGTAAITLTEVITSSAGLAQPVDIANAGDDRLFIAEKEGRIRIYDGATVLPTPFLDITSLVASGGTLSSEAGLLGLAFHPDYADNGYFYVSYLHEQDDSTLVTRVARYKVRSLDPNRAEIASGAVILEFMQDQSNHNGGDLSFGPNDGYLYISTGDGGIQGDPLNHAQTDTQLLGKILRIDVDGSAGADCDISGNANYDIPATNPLSDGPGGNCDEIWANGLRNPWRFSFDRNTGDMWIGDVGHQDWEEVNFQPAVSEGGENWGWHCYEGNEAYNTAGCGPISNYNFPVYAYHQGGATGECSVIGGFVYRGTAVPALTGHYLFTDYCSKQFWSLSNGSYKTLTSFGLADVLGSGDLGNPTTFGEDVNGELYVAENGTDASIFKITAASQPYNVTQAIPLFAGWNTVSSYVEPQTLALETLMAGIESDMDLMKDGGGQVYWPAQMINEIGDWDVRDGYQIYMDSPATLLVSGQYVDPARTPNNLLAGWNLVSYLRYASMPPAVALDSISAGLVIGKNSVGEVYWPLYGVDGIGEMQPGEGYELYMAGAGILTYPGN